MSDLLNEQDPETRYEKHKEWRNRHKGSQESGEGLRGQNARKREMDKKLNKIPGRKQGGMEAAREAVRQAKERGDLVQPEACEKCGAKTDRLIFHHANGYDPEHFLDGNFFCDDCHAKDDNNREGDHTIKGPVRGPRPGMERHKVGDHDEGHKLPKHVAKATDSVGLNVLNMREDKIVNDVARMITEDPDTFNEGSGILPEDICPYCELPIAYEDLVDLNLPAYCECERDDNGLICPGCKGSMGLEGKCGPCGYAPARVRPEFEELHNILKKTRPGPNDLN